jgi:hypothetical protein
MSETPSGTPRKRDECVLLLDENVSSITVAEILSKVPDWTIELHSNHFERGASDAEVAEYCGQRGWALVTCDDMRYTPETKRAIAANNVRVLKVVVKKKTLGVEIAASLVIAREKILGFLKKNRTAVVVHIQKDGSLQVMNRFEEPMKPLTASQQRTARKFGNDKLF